MSTKNISTRETNSKPNSLDHEQYGEDCADPDEVSCWRITNTRSGLDLGTWPGNTKQDALDAMARAPAATPGRAARGCSPGHGSLPAGGGQLGAAPRARGSNFEN